MAEKNLPVPYISQHQADLKDPNNYCGEASLAMALTFLGRATLLQEVLKILGNPQGFTNFNQLTQVATGLGFQTQLKVDSTFDVLKSYLDQNLPVIVVGGYGYLNSTQDKEFKGSHIMVVCGYRDDGSVYVNDPNFWGPIVQEGNHHVYTSEEFMAFWRNEGNIDGNIANTLFVVTKPAPVSPSPSPFGKVLVTSPIGVNARTETKVNVKNIAKVFGQGSQLVTVAKLTGDAVNGDNNWFKINDNGRMLFVWAGAVTEQAPIPTPPAPTPPNVEKPLTDDSIKALQSVYLTVRDHLISLNALPGETHAGVNSSVWQSIKNFLGIKA